jgi:hypothetical protein
MLSNQLSMNSSILRIQTEITLLTLLYLWKIRGNTDQITSSLLQPTVTLQTTRQIVQIISCTTQRCTHSTHLVRGRLFRWSRQASTGGQGRPCTNPVHARPLPVVGSLCQAARSHTPLARLPPPWPVRSATATRAPAAGCSHAVPRARSHRLCHGASSVSLRGTTTAAEDGGVAVSRGGDRKEEAASSHKAVSLRRRS